MWLLWKPLTPFRGKESNGNEKWKTKEKQRPTVGQRKFCSLFPTLPAFTAPGAAWMGNKETFELSRKVGRWRTHWLLHTWQTALHWENREYSQLWMYPSKKSPVQTEIILPFEAQRSCSNKNTAQEPPTNIWLQIWFQTLHLPTAKCASLQETSPAQWDLSSAEHFLGVILSLNTFFSEILLACSRGFFAPGWFCYREF